MSTPIYSKATGRSGPKTKTGCSTCRRRKVRCDEGRPTCANCTRLKISCGFLDAHFRSGSSSRGSARLRHSIPKPRSQQVQEVVRSSCEVAGGGSAEGYLSYVSIIDNSTFAPAGFQNEEGVASNYESALTPLHESQESRQDLSGELYFSHQVSGLPDMQEASVFNFPETLAFQDVFLSSINSTDMSLGSCSGLPQAQTSDNLTWTIPTETDNSLEQTTSVLLEHFTQASNPIAVIVPTHIEWTTASRTLLSMAQNSPALLDAICAHSALHLYTCRKGNEMLDIAYSHYQASSSQVTIFFEESHQNTTDQPTNNPDLKKAFAAVFLLSHVELIAQSTPKALTWPLQHVHAAHTRVRQYSESIQGWAGTSRRLLSWMTLLQNKAEYNGGSPCANRRDDETFEHSSSSSERQMDENVDQTKDGSVWGRSNHGNGVWGTVVESPSPAELLREIINQPALEFHLRAQSFTPRIIALDKHHHKRGTLETDFEILKRGISINASLHSLWEERPAIFLLLEDPIGISDILQPSYGKVVLRNLRVYSANFWAHYIYLHRVAFVAYPATDDVTRAVSQISELAKTLSADLSQQQDGDCEVYCQNSPSSLSHDEIHLPHSMFWLLFMLCLECPSHDRGQFLDMVRKICCLPNFDKGVLLLEEVLRRQDAANVRIDHRDVRKELFDSELSVIY
uniref:Zn(2)-C6 fungal-type domain-containing protein n=1 Tax=Bionectria ochroleuca TaxID=29856 RepID=A0A8H7K978_BIOOC